MTGGLAVVIFVILCGTLVRALRFGFDLVVVFAFDGGVGLQEVSVSTDKGVSWEPAQLGKDLGNYSFREWSFNWTPTRKVSYRLMARAKNRRGESQPSDALWNPSGYMRNVIEGVDVMVD